MSRIAWLALVLVVTGCGAREPEADERPPVAADSSSPAEEPSPSPKQRKPRPAPEPGTAVTVEGSPFGPMLFDDRGQAIYLFEPESGGRPACYGDCATAWPPVLTEGDPVARAGLRPRQVTFGGGVTRLG